MDRQWCCPRDKFVQKYFTDQQALTLDFEAAAARPGGLCLAQMVGKVIAVSRDMGDFKGTAVHPGLLEQDSPQGFILQPSQVCQVATQAGDGEYAASKYYGPPGE